MENTEIEEDQINDEIVVEGHEENDNLPRKKMKTRSVVWDHFKKFFDTVEGKEKARCNYCDKSYICDTKKNGTSTLKYHMSVCKKHPYEQLTRQSKIQFTSKSATDVGDEDNAEVSSLGLWKFSQERSRKDLAEMIIVDELPFSHVENRGFKKWARSMNPQFVVPSRSTVTRDCYELYLEERFRLRRYLRKCGCRVSITTDSWTSIQRVNYMVLTAHYIDETWKLQKKILNFCPISSHKGEDIGKAIEICLKDWGMEQIFSVIVDNASSNNVAISYLKKTFARREKLIMQGKLLHVRCVAHIINLVVQDGLKEVGSSVARVRRAIRYVRSSPARLKKFKGCEGKENVECKRSLCLDVPTRWNSTYLMLDTAEKKQKAFERYEEEDANFRIELEREREKEEESVEDGVEVQSGCPIEEDWLNVRRMCHFLRHFYELTLRVSGSSFMTSNQVFNELTDVDCLLKKWIGSQDFELSLMATKMKAKYDSYWGSIEKINSVIFLAVVVDPRHKLDYVEFAIERMYAGEEGKRLSRRVREAIFEMFEEYKMTYQPSEGTQSQTEALPGRRPQGGETEQTVKNEMLKLYKRKQIESGAGEFKSELQKYLSDTNEEDNGKFDILDWWKKNSSRYPIVASMARDLLGVPISTVASESAFSTGGRVLDAFRSSLTPKIAQALICAQDWLRGGPVRIEEDLENLESLENDFASIPLAGAESSIVDIESGIYDVV